MNMNVDIYKLTPKSSFLLPLLISKVSTNDGAIEDLEHLTLENDYASFIGFDKFKSSPEILFDFGKKITGFIFLNVESSSDDYVQYSYGPTPESLYWSGKIRVPNDGKFVIDDHFIALRYLKISLASRSIPPADCWIRLKSLGIKFSAYPVVYRGSFMCDDELLNRVWYSGVYTTQLCLQKNKYSIIDADSVVQEKRSFVEQWKSIHGEYVIWDAPRRDREVWLADVRAEALTTYYAFGAYETVKSTLDLLSQHQNKEGIMPANGTNRYFEFVDFNFWWIISLWEFYFYTGDISFIKSVYPNYKSLIDWIVYNTDDAGFIESKRLWTWTLERSKKSAQIQCILYHTILCAANIEKVMDEYDNQDLYQKLAEKVKENFNKRFWDDTEGVYTDSFDHNGCKGVIFSDTNVFSVVFGIADKEKSLRILGYLKRNMWTEFGSTTTDKLIDGPESIWPHNRQIWPFINAYEVEANFIVGNIDEAFDLIKRCWGNILDKGSNTFWEMVDSSDGTFSLRPFAPLNFKHDSINSYCHGWSGWISFILQAYVLGVRPIEPGLSKVIIQPKLGKLTSLTGEVPSSFGVIKISIEAKDDCFEMNIAKPEAVKVLVDLCNILHNYSKVLINKIVVYDCNHVIDNILVEGIEVL